jgi:hypothetical protein
VERSTAPGFSLSNLGSSLFANPLDDLDGNLTYGYDPLHQNAMAFAYNNRSWMTIPDWFYDLAWPDGITFGELLNEPLEILFEPVSKEGLQAVWRQRLMDAVTMGNDPWKVRTQAICDWLASAGNDLKLLIVGSKSRSMLIDMHHKAAFPMSCDSSGTLESDDKPNFF